MRRTLPIIAAVVSSVALIGLAGMASHAAPTATPVASCDTDSECAELPICKADPTCDGGPVNTPRWAVVLVGQGCGPKREVMIAREEDEFPTTCERIDAHWLP